MVQKHHLSHLESALPEMASPSTTDVIHNFPPFFRVHKDGTITRFFDSPIVPPFDGGAEDSNNTAVRSKDVVISPEPKVSARLFLSKITTPNQKLPLLVYIHGGGFSIGSAFSEFYTNYLNSLVANSNVIAVSVDYRLAPEHPIPACYEDSWAVLKWVTSHVTGKGSDPWLNEHADFGRVFLAGDSAGANIAHNMATRAGVDGFGCDVKIAGMVLVHPFFGDGNEPSTMWKIICPESGGAADPRLSPGVDLGLLSKIGCRKVLICTAENDFLRERGWSYYEDLKKSEWGGEVEIVETKGEGHVFHLFNPTCEKAGELVNLMASFLNK